jgi:hypothetical protein
MRNPEATSKNTACTVSLPLYFLPSRISGFRAQFLCRPFTWQRSPWSNKGKKNCKIVPLLNQLSTTPWRRMGEWMYISTCFLVSALAGGEWWASRPGRFTSGEKDQGAHWMGGWVGPRAGLDNMERTKFLTPPPGWTARSQTLYWLRYPGSMKEVIEV